MKAYFKKPFFRKTFLIYTVILVVSFLAFTISSYYQVHEQNSKLQRQDIASKMELLTRILDDKFTEMERIGTQLSHANWVKKVRSRSDILYRDIDIIRQQEICQEMNAYHAIVRVAKSTALLLPQKEMAIDRVSFWEDTRYFATLNDAAADKIPDGLAVLSESYSAFLILPVEDGTGDFLLMRQLNFARSPELVLLFYISAEAFENQLFGGYDGLASLEILQQEETVFTYGEGDAEAGFHESTYDSALYNWSYRYRMENPDTIPFETFLLFCGAVFFSLMAGFFLSYFIARATYRPVSALLSQMGAKPQDGGENEFELIAGTLQALRREKMDFEKLSSQYFGTVRNNILQSLLGGSFTQTAVIKDMAQYRIPFTNEMYYLVILITYPEQVEGKQRALDYVRLSEFHSLSRQNAQVMETSEHSLAIILYEDNPEHGLIAAANSCRDYCAEILDKQASFLCGIPHQGLIGISRSYQVAKEQSMETAGTVRRGYSYPIDWEIQMINYLKVGNEAAVTEILCNLREENQSRELLEEEFGVAATLILETLLRVSMDLRLSIEGVREEFAKVVRSGDREWIWDYLFGFAEVLCKRSGYFETNHASDIGRQMAEYVDTHFQNYSLTQQTLADHFQLSRSAASKLFKKAKDINFIDYLHLLRVQSAKALFDAGETDVRAVAKAVGYENEITFKRAFLRTESVTPREYAKAGKRK